MKYKGYFGEVTYDDEATLFHGQVIGLKDVITFQGKSVNELKQAFQDSINDYLAWCAERGEQPEKTYSGKLHIRMNPNLHAHLATEASQLGLSLNDLVNQKLSR
jgi:predicted HicB family RNase H-like nuclease